MGSSFIYRFNQREELAFEVVFKATYFIMIGLAIKIINNKNEAEDVVIVAYRKLWESDAKFNSYIQIRAYITKAVKNECYNYLVKLRKTINRIRELTPDIEIGKRFIQNRPLRQSCKNSLSVCQSITNDYYYCSFRGTRTRTYLL